MFSPNPHFSYFNLIIPPEFFINSVTDKYDRIIKQYDYPLKDIQSIFFESLQSVQFPGFGYTPYSQGVVDGNNASYDWFQPPKSSEQLLASQKLLNVNFKHVNSFMTYFFALETFFTRYKMGPNNETGRQPFGTMILETLDDISKQPICRLKFHKCNLIGLSELDLTYSDPKRDMGTYTLTFAYTEFESTINIPDLVLKENKNL